MKTKLLKKLRNRGRNIITIYSITTRGGLTTGMSYGCPSDDYRDLFSLGDTKEEVIEKAMRIYIEKEIKRLRLKKKYMWR